MTITSARLAAGAWAPGFAIFAVRLSGRHQNWSIGMAAACALSLLSMFLLLRAREDTNRQTYTFRSVKDETAQVPGYVVGFVFPFVFWQVGPWREVVAIALFAVLLTILVIATDLVIVNPVLLLFGFRTYTVSTGSGGNGYNGYCITDERLIVGRQVVAVHLAFGSSNALLARRSFNG